MTFNELAGKRYSCRKLASKPVEQEKLVGLKLATK